MVMLKESEVYNLKLREALWPVRKESIQSQMLEGKLRLCSVWVAWAGLMLLKNPEISKRRAPAVPIVCV